MRVILFTVMLFICSGLFAQNSGIGFKLGGNYATLASQAAAENIYVPGFHAGFYFPIRIRARLEIQPEVLFSSQGGGYQFPSSKSISRLNYLSVPVAAKLYFGNWFNVQGGPQFSYLINANTTKNDEEALIDTQDFFAHDVSFIFGLGYDDRQGFDVTLRYVMGMTALLREDAVLFPKNQVLQLSVGYRFSQGRGRRR